MIDRWPLSLVGLMIMAAALIGCRAAAPQHLTLGPREYVAPRYLGTLPLWEGPGELTVGRAWISPHSLAIASTREMQGMLAEMWRENGQVTYRAAVYPGAVTAVASDGRGNIVVHQRFVTAKGDLYDLERDGLYLDDVRRRLPPRALDAPAVNQLRGGTLTVVCGVVGGGFVAWIEAPGGFKARPVAAPGVAPPPSSVPQMDLQLWPPLMCAAEDDCASAMFEQGAAPPFVETRCNGPVERQVLEDHWPSSTILHPRGTVAAWDSSHRQSTVRVRLPGAPPRTFAMPGTVYAVTFWDRRTLLVHLAEGQANTPTRLSLVTLDAERGSLTKSDLDFARGPMDLRSLPDLALLPSHGNGRPLVGRIDDDIVLITGTGEIWTWRAQR